MANGTLKVSNIQTSSGSGTITLGQSGETVDFSNATTTLNSAMKNTPAFLAYLADQSISDATETTIVCDTEVYDTNSAYDTSTGKFTVPSGEAGKYTFTLFTFIEHNNSNDYRQIYSVFQKNDGSVGYGSTHQLYHENFSNNFRGCSLSYTLTLDLAVGDTVKGKVYQDNAADAARGLEQASFSGFKLIGV
jgi:hypothetical protein